MTQQQTMYLQKTGVLLAVYLFLKYLLPLGLPFFLAWLTVHFLVWLQRWIRLRLFSLSVCFLLSCTLLAGAAVLGGCALLYEPCRELLPVCRDYWNHFSAGLTWIPQSLSGYLMAQTPAAAACLFGVFLYLISVLLLARDWEKTRQILRRLPFFLPVSRAAGRLALALRGWLRAQGKILLVVWAECAAGYYFLDVPFFWFWAFLTGLLDALPVFGTGVVFLPWIVIRLLWGDISMALWLAVLLAVTWLTREFLEPRLLGSGLGLLPIGFLMSVIIGLKLFGPFGLFSGPFGVLLVRELWAELQRTAPPSDPEASSSGDGGTPA